MCAKIPIDCGDEKKTAKSTAERSLEEADSSAAVEPAGPAPGAEELKKKIEKLESQNKEYLDHLQRLQAEFENYRRRTQKEKSETIKFGISQMAEKMLVVADNLRRGLSYAAENATDKKILSGISLIERQLLDTLAEFGVKPIDTLGEAFDPNLHDPVYTIERDDVEENKIVEEIEKGYSIHDKILRAAKVVVSRRHVGSTIISENAEDGK
jgi:molecular chaperone GrpE